MIFEVFSFKEVIEINQKRDKKEENYKIGKTCMVLMYKCLYFNNLVLIRCI